jgi:uncharacterized protein (AIM24 family)
MLTRRLLLSSTSKQYRNVSKSISSFIDHDQSVVSSPSLYFIPQNQLLLLLRRRRLMIHQNRSLSSKEYPVEVVSSHLPLTLSDVDFPSAVRIEGEETQVATITLQPGQSIRAESGSMIFMTSGITMETSSTISDGMKRFLTGQSLFVTDFTAMPTIDSTNNNQLYGSSSSLPKKQQQVAVGPAFPSKLLQLYLPDYGGTLLCSKGAYVASNTNVTIDLGFTKSFSSGFFGGQGFVLQQLTGQGHVLLQASGALIRKDLQQGQSLRISSGTLVAMTSTIDFDVQLMPGFRNVLFGGEGLFVTTLRGPGTVWIQSMPPDRMVSEIARRVPSSGGMGFGVPIGIGGTTSAAPDDASVNGDGLSPADASTPQQSSLSEEHQESIQSNASDYPQDGGNTPDSLFGDAVASSSGTNTTAPDYSTDSSDLYSTESTSNNDYSDNSTTFGDDTSSTVSSDQFNEESFWKDNNDTSSTMDSDEGSFSNVVSDDNGMLDTAKRVLSDLWDFFHGDD